MSTSQCSKRISKVGACYLLFLVAQFNLHAQSADGLRQIGCHVYTNTTEWLKAQGELQGKQINFVCETNRFCPMDALVELGCELQSTTFSSLVARILQPQTNVTQSLRFNTFVLKKAKYVEIRILLDHSFLPKEMTDEFQALVEHYINTRIAGHSTEYAFASLQAGLRTKTNPMVASDIRARIMQMRWIPKEWVLEEKGDESKVIVSDGGYAWVFLLEPMAPVMRRDLKEFDPKTRDQIAEALEQARHHLISSDSEGTALTNIPADTLWRAAQSILQAQYGILWESPTDLNDGVTIHLDLTKDELVAPTNAVAMPED